MHIYGENGGRWWSRCRCCGSDIFAIYEEEQKERRRRSRVHDVILAGVVMNSAKPVWQNAGGGGLKYSQAPWSKNVGGSGPAANRSLRLWVADRISKLSTNYRKPVSPVQRLAKLSQTGFTSATASHHSTNYHKPVSPVQRLAITLRSLSAKHFLCEKCKLYLLPSCIFQHQSMFG